MPPVPAASILEPLPGLEPRAALLDAPPQQRGIRAHLKSSSAIYTVVAISIGSGEWLLGPAAAVRYGTWILCIATLSILLQHTFNLSVARYTLFTGEPVHVGFLRTRGGALTWATLYSLLAITQVVWPGYVASAAASWFYVHHIRLPGTDDTLATYKIAVVSLLLCVTLMLFGRVIARTVTNLSKIMVFYILPVLVIVNIWFIPSSHWVRTLGGFIGIGRHATPLTTSSDWLLLAAFVGYAGAGGIFNLLISNNMRDKKYGAAQWSRSIRGLIGGKDGTATDQDSGRVDLDYADNRARLADWISFVRKEQIVLWLVPCFLSLYLTTNLYSYFLPPGSSLSGVGASAELVNAMASAGVTYSSVLRALALCGFLILFSSQLGALDCIARQLSDIFWAVSPRVRTLTGGDQSKLYYAILIAFVTCSALLLGASPPLTLIKLMGFASSLILAVAAPHLLFLNRSVIPREFRSRAEELGLVGVWLLFFGVCMFAAII